MNQRFQHFSRQHIPLILAGIATVCLSACDQSYPATYKVPKEERVVTLPDAPASTAPEAGAPAKMQVLPGMQEAADKAGKVGYTTPKGWEELAASGMRKGNFKVSDKNGSAEITILTFPGDVGGRLANINRWRGQVGLPAASPEDLPAYTEGTEISNHRGLYVRLEGETNSILGALLPFHGNTWFFKMLGDTPTVLANEAAMKQLLSSIVLEDHAH